MVKRIILVLIYPMLCVFQGLALLSLVLFQLLYWVIYGKVKFSYEEINDILEYTEKKARKCLLS